MSKTILVAGATGNLGGKIINELINHNVTIRALVRGSTDERKIQLLTSKNIEVCKISEYNIDEIAKACQGVDCLVSVLAGLEDTIFDTQKILVQGAIRAKVPRFIPSDFCTDFTNLKYGNNRNLDLRKKFHEYLNQQPIKSTSIFNGAFMELTTGDMPLILFGRKKILCWGDRTVKMDLTTTYNIAEYTAFVAIDESTPRYLKIAGDSVSCNDVAQIMTEISKSTFKIFRPGGIRLLRVMIAFAKFFDFSKRICIQLGKECNI